MKTIAELFAAEPGQWGLRGDPFLWRALRGRFEGVEIPATTAQLYGVLQAEFEQVTGHSIATKGAFFVPEFAGGGMSSGQVSPEFWRERAIPLILSRYQAGR